MRIHRLRAQAFGPFTDEVEVDLDALSDAGLFLLTGATGAGKTSVLDAVCFALYGAVPGDRQSAKRLRSDQAAPGVAPEVDLELTVDGRRFRIHRSPAWERAKKRGHGTTTQQASVLVEERVADEWRALATRLDDAGHLVTGLLGMNLTQFCQVQLLPQGRFQAFLRAGSEERHQLLQQLFRTSRFEDVEAWLRERRRHLRRESARHHERVADLVSRTSEASGDPLPESWDLHALEPVADLVGGWVDGLAEAAAHRSAAAADRRSVAADREQGSADRLRVGRELAERQQRHARASEEQESLAAEGEAHARREQLLDAGRRSLAVVPLVEAARRAEQVAAAAEARAERATAEAAAALDEPELAGLLDAPEWSERSRGAAETAAEVRARQPLVAELTELLATLADDEAVLAGSTSPWWRWLRSRSRCRPRWPSGVRPRRRRCAPTRPSPPPRSRWRPSARDVTPRGWSVSWSASAPRSPPCTRPRSTTPRSAVRRGSTCRSVASPGWPPRSRVPWRSVPTARSAARSTTPTPRPRSPARPTPPRCVTPAAPWTTPSPSVTPVRWP